MWKNGLIRKIRWTSKFMASQPGKQVITIHILPKISRSKVSYSLFLLYAKLRAINRYWSQAADHLLIPHVKLFLKIKRGRELVSLPHFLHDFWRKIFILLYSMNWPNFIVWLPYFVRYWATCVLQLFVNQVVTSWTLKSTLWPKRKDKKLNIFRTKRNFKMK